MTLEHYEIKFGPKIQLLVTQLEQLNNLVVAMVAGEMYKLPMLEEGLELVAGEKRAELQGQYDFYKQMGVEIIDAMKQQQLTSEQITAFISEIRNVTLNPDQATEADIVKFEEILGKVEVIRQELKERYTDEQLGVVNR